MKRNTTLAALAVCASAAVGISALVAPSASADPTNPGATTFRLLSAAGSDTTEAVMNGYADSITASGSDYKKSGLVFAATIVGATTVQTSILPVVGEVLTIGVGTAGSETATVVSIDATATANTAAVGSTNAVQFNTITVDTDGVTAGNQGLANAHAANEVVTGNFLAAGTKVLSSWNAQGGAFQAKANANCKYEANNVSGNAYSGVVTQNGATSTGPNSGYVSGYRSNGSGNGARAMADSFTASNKLWGCTDIGRASSKRSNVSGLGTNKTINVPFASDAVDFAVTTTSSFQRKQSWTDLIAIYKCTYNKLGVTMIPATATIPSGVSTQDYAADPNKYDATIAPGTVYAYATIPQSGSGTRDFIVSALGLTTNGTKTSGDVGAACITDKTPTGGVLEEHDLRTLDDLGIGVTSIAQSVSQRAQAVTGILDRQGRTVLVAVDNTAAGNGGTAKNNGKLNYAVEMVNQFGGATGNTGGNLQLWRDVFNAIPVDRAADPNLVKLLGTTGSICSSPETLALYGFSAPSTTCGIFTNIG